MSLCHVWTFVPDDLQNGWFMKSGKAYQQKWNMTLITEVSNTNSKILIAYTFVNVAKKRLQKNNLVLSNHDIWSK